MITCLSCSSAPLSFSWAWSYIMLARRGMSIMAVGLTALTSSKKVDMSLHGAIRSSAADMPRTTLSCPVAHGCRYYVGHWAGNRLSSSHLFLMNQTDPPDINDWLIDKRPRTWFCRAEGS